METWHGRLLVALVSALAAGGRAAAAAEAADAEAAPQPRPAAGSGVAQPTAVPLLLTLLKDLRAEAEAGLAIDGSMARWCQDARGQTTGLEQALRRQVGEAGNEVRQVALESKRLISEASLINSTTDQKEEQLKDSTAAVQGASTQFLAERRQLETMLEAAGHAIDFLDAQSESGERPSATADQSLSAELVSSLAQLQRAADIGGPPLELLSRQGVQGAHQLRQTLVRLQDSLQRGLASSAQEEQDMKQKHWIFADHLSSSVMEIQSQIAAVKMEAAQRKRERLRLEARIGDLTTLLAAATEGSRATDATCAEDDRQRKEIAEHIKAESAIVKSMLAQAPSVGGLGQPTGPPGAPTFLQVREKPLTSTSALKHAVGDLESMTGRFSQDAAWYDGASRMLQLQAKANGPPVRGPRGEGSSALDNIRQFVVAASAAGVKAPDRAGTAADQVGGTRGISLANASGKQQAAADQRGRCVAILRDAETDRAALERSFKRADSKRRIAKAMTSEYERNSLYNKEHANILSQLVQRLNNVSQDSASLRARAGSVLRGHVEELLALADDLAQQPSADEQHTARLVRSLVNKVHSHQVGLQLQRARSLELKGAVDAAAERLLKLLAGDAERNRHRLVHLRAEEQLMSNLAFAKANDRDLGKLFFEKAAKLCSDDGQGSSLDRGAAGAPQPQPAA